MFKTVVFLHILLRLPHQFYSTEVNVAPIHKNEDIEVARLPDDFLFGVSTSSYQIEGAWNKGGRVESIWDRAIHSDPQSVVENATADDATKSLEFYKEDVQLMANLGINFYRFSFAWTRIYPDATGRLRSMEGVEYYNRLIDELLAHNITPMVTIYHWDLPQELEDDGGFLNPYFPVFYAEYAEFCFQQFGDRVKHWLTFNEPKEICVRGYGETMYAPMLNKHGVGEYLCNKHLLEAHARAYHIYNTTYREIQKGEVGITLSAQWMEPETDSLDDLEAAEDARQFNIGLFAHPIFSKEGGYPERVTRRVPSSRLPLPELPDSIQLVGSADFMAINHYTSYMVNRSSPRPQTLVPSFENDMDVNEKRAQRFSKSWVRHRTAGFGKVLRWISEQYSSPTMIVTENGQPSQDGLNDDTRIWFIRRYLAEALRVRQSGVDLRGYGYWSLIDNFEWFRGYTDRFGLYEIDFNSPNKTRIQRKSADAYKHIIETKIIDPDYNNNLVLEDYARPIHEDYAFQPVFNFNHSSILPIQDGVREMDETRVLVNNRITVIDVLNSQIVYGLDGHIPGKFMPELLD